MFLIIGLLVSLILLTGRLSGGKYALVDYLSIRLPFSLYFGWLTVATIANVVVWLVSLNWNGFGISPEIWTSLILILGAAIGIMTALSRSDWSYLAVFIWAYVGIWLKHTSPTAFAGEYEVVSALLPILIGVLLSGTVYLAYRWPTGQFLKA